ncbi:hypothetical protein PsorP6_013201 [Peronosclerospora sorghi]|uniref:Uncharacterized protein n=1 Tax=Peronosclerospora sorghi TaxID=230839 RepID=A0ACC0WGG9_9STRA|nr:hypothetical protein PsorP6_013201 [Peronosclerospora sorghi]
MEKVNACQRLEHVGVDVETRSDRHGYRRTEARPLSVSNQAEDERCRLDATKRASTDADDPATDEVDPEKPSRASNMSRVRVLSKEKAHDTAFSPPVSQSYRQRFSIPSTITPAVPRRRTSYSMKRRSLQSTAVSSSCTTVDELEAPRRRSASAGPMLATSVRPSRRNSTSIVRREPTRFYVEQHEANNSWFSTDDVVGPSTTAIAMETVPTFHWGSSVLGVRERSRDGVPELVLANKPAPSFAWRHWSDRALRTPFLSVMTLMDLGPAHHGLVLHQLRYVTSRLHECPWAKAQLRTLLSTYRAMAWSTAECYPRLHALGEQVQRVVRQRARQLRVQTAAKQRRTVTLTTLPPVS